MFVRYADLPQTAFPAAPSTVAVLPLAAVESHGPHLPLGTDALIADGILDRSATFDEIRAHPVLRLPTLWLGASAEHGGAGTLSIEPEPLVAQIVAVAEGLARVDVRRVVLFNAHGGNVAAAAIAALRLRTRFGMLAASVHWLDFGLPDDLAPPSPVAEDVHGGWIETSMIFHLAPHLIVREAITPNPPKSPAASLFPSGRVGWGWKTEDLATGGWIGRPELARPELGRILVDHAAKNLVRLLAEVAGAAWLESS